MKSRSVAILLALFLGGIGIHRFYLNQPGRGFLYLIFCWTFIPLFIALFDALIWLVNSDQTFDSVYNKNAVSNPNRNLTNNYSSSVADEIEKLHTLHQRGIISQQEFERKKQQLLKN